MLKVLFVCLGNICRSPMAEAVFRHQVKAAGLIDRIGVDSAGTGEWHIGHAPHKGMQELLDRVRIEHRGIVARQVQRGDWAEFDYIVAMDTQNRKDLLELIVHSSEEEQTKEKVHLFMDFVPHASVQDVPDPYFTGNFDEVYHLVEEGCRQLLVHIQQHDLDM